MLNINSYSFNNQPLKELKTKTSIPIMQPNKNLTVDKIHFGNASKIQADLQKVFLKHTKGDNPLFEKVNTGFIAKLAKKLDSNPNYTIKIGMTGESGSGKSTYFEWLQKRAKEKYNIQPCEIRRDQYMNSYENGVQAHGGNYNKFSATGALEGSECIDFNRIITDMKKLSKGKTVFPKKRHRNTGVIEAQDFENPIKPAKIILMEGIGLFDNKKFTDSLDIKIYANAPNKIIKQRWFDRAPSRGKTGQDAIDCYKITKEKAKKYTTPFKKNADIILNTQAYTEKNKSAINNFTDDFIEVLKKHKWNPTSPNQV